MKKIKLVISNRRGRRQTSKEAKRAKNRNIHYIMLPFILPVHKVVGVIKYPRGGFLAQGAHARSILTACTGNANVTIAPGDVTYVDGKITAFQTSTAANRPGTKTKMTEAIEEKLLAPFQAKANSDPSNSILILQSGGFHCKEQGLRHVTEFAVVNGAVAGEVEAITAGGPARKNHLHNWFWSLDGIIFHWKKSTNKAKTTLSGFNSGDKVYFCTELCIQDVSQGMSNLIQLRIK